MRNRVRLLITFILVLGIGFFNNVMALGPPSPPGGGGGQPPCWPPSSCVPLNDGLIFLLLAGALYGVKMAYDVAQQKKID